MRIGSSAQLAWVTGASGFIGRHLVQELITSGFQVVGFCRTLPTQNIPGLIDLVPGGLNTEGIDRALTRHGSPSLVYHFAGGGAVRASFENPLADFESSVASTIRILESLRQQASFPHFVLASSAAVYGGQNFGPISLSSSLLPISPYGHHKCMAERVATGYAITDGMRITILRLFSVYGPQIGKQLIFELCSRLAESETPLVLSGTGKELRDWCHVSDVVRLCRGLEPAAIGKPSLFNVGVGVGIELADVVQLTLDAWGSKAAVTFSGKSPLGDPFSLIADPASRPPGFDPKVKIQPGIEDFVKWFKATNDLSFSPRSSS